MMNITPLENWIIRKSGLTVRSRKELEDYQLNQLRKVIGYVKDNSRFYQSLLSGISPNDISSLDDMNKMPFTFSHDIQKEPFSFLCVPQDQIKRIVTLRSTGTSGHEKRVFFSEEDLNLTIDFFVYGMSCLVNRSDRVMVLLPGNSYGSIGDLLKKALEFDHVDCVVHGVITNYEETAKAIVSQNSTCLVGIPIQVMNLYRRYRDIFKSRIQKVLLSTDYVPEVLIRELTDQGGCQVFTHYGMTEMGYGGGVECEALNGYHMREADLYFEIIDPATGRTLPDGQWGEVAFTTLTRTAMPLLRYRTGDRGCFSMAPCACGTILKTMKRVKGRLENKITIHHQDLYLKDLDELILAFPEVMEYTACLSEDGSLNLAVSVIDSRLFGRIAKDIAGSVEVFVKSQFGENFYLPILVTKKDNPDKITNSMCKRTITVSGTSDKK